MGRSGRGGVVKRRIGGWWGGGGGSKVEGRGSSGGTLCTALLQLYSQCECVCAKQGNGPDVVEVGCMECGTGEKTTLDDHSAALSALYSSWPIGISSGAYQRMACEYVSPPSDKHTQHQYFSHAPDTPL